MIQGISERFDRVIKASSRNEKRLDFKNEIRNVELDTQLYDSKFSIRLTDKEIMNVHL